MKKRSLWIAVLLLCVWACLWAVACKKNEREVLETPQNLKIENEYLTWNDVENATGYTVDINGEFYETESNSLDIFLLTTEEETYEMKVVSIGDGEDTIDSDWSEPIEYIIPGFQIEYRKTKDQTGYEIQAKDKNQLKGKVVLPSEIDGLPVKRIVNNGFSDCTELESIILPDSIVELGSGAFSRCTSLKRIYLSDELEKIGSSCFMDCVALTEIEIPALVSNNISGYAFANCGNLTSIKVDEDNSTYRSENNCLIKNDGDVLVRGCKNSVIPESVKEIGASAFSGVGLTGITIPESVKEIGAGAFSRCVSLTEITIPESVKEIGNGAFYGCGSLTEMTIPGSVKDVKQKIFQGCTSLQRIIFAEGVVNLGHNPEELSLPFLPNDSSVEESQAKSEMTEILAECPSLQSISIPSTVEVIAVDLIRDLGMNVSVEISPKNQTYKMDGNCLIRKTDNVLVCGRVECTIPDYVTKIGAFAFKGLDLQKRVVLPTGVTEIDDCAFYKATGLECIILPTGMQKIGAMAFMRCKQLQFINIPMGMTEIRFKAFRYCPALTSILIPDSVQTIGEYAVPQVYTTLETFPEGWAPWEGSPMKYITQEFYGCTFGYDNGIAYVESWKKPYFSEDNNLDSIWAEPPYREGYTFKGWSLEENSDEIFIGLKIYQDPFWDEDPWNGTTIMDLKPSPQKFKDLPVGTVLYAVWEKNA